MPRVPRDIALGPPWDAAPHKMVPSLWGDFERLEFWGVRTTSQAKRGDMVQIFTSNGKSWIDVIREIRIQIGDTALCETLRAKPVQPAPQPSPYTNEQLARLVAMTSKSQPPPAPKPPTPSAPPPAPPPPPRRRIVGL